MDDRENNLYKENVWKASVPVRWSSHFDPYLNRVC